MITNHPTKISEIYSTRINIQQLQAKHCKAGCKMEFLILRRMPRKIIYRINFIWIYKISKIKGSADLASTWSTIIIVRPLLNDPSRDYHRNMARILRFRREAKKARKQRTRSTKFKIFKSGNRAYKRNNKIWMKTFNSPTSVLEERCQRCQRSSTRTTLAALRITSRITRTISHASCWPRFKTITRNRTSNLQTWGTRLQRKVQWMEMNRVFILDALRTD